MLVKQLTSRVVAGILAASSFWAGPLSFVLGLIIGQLVKYGDWLAYYLGDSWKNSSNAEDYQKAGEDLNSLPPTATKEERDAKKQAKADALDKLMGAS